ncbi:cytochrome P450 [Leucogyrophana mollusca]|uniref:Cytochrome P450 n=1 Tax=Leucogyrophana mollusca TaxID=85980 RepID=A0ACB8BVY9_9AGAM|nr:cytochrome P450 [Leucogyrophana mollusca]
MVLGPVSGIALLAVLLALRIAQRKRHDKRRLPLPPGPRPLPFFGNVLEVKLDEPWITYKEWGATYGDIIYSRLLNQEIVVINSEEVANALLEKRSHNYSDRPRVATSELFGFDFATFLMPYGDMWRLHRRLFHQVFRQDASLAYRPVQLREAYRLLTLLLGSPKSYDEHLQSRHSASIIMSIVYDYDTAPRKDPLVTAAQTALDIGLKVATPETAAILGAFPILQYIPSWFPGPNYQRSGLNCRKYMSEMIELPFQYVRNSMAAGTAKTSMVGDALQRRQDEGDRDQFEGAVKNTAATAFAAGAETTSSTLQMFILAMMNYPEVQKRAQAEIDSVVGKDRLPTFEDRPSLPFVEAVLRETQRWRPVLPLGVPHATTNDDIYDGYYIPKGRAMSRNEAKYPHASEFKPERFFTADGRLNDDTVRYVFGFGRRLCPGLHLADATLWSAMASLLAVFNIMKPVDESGKEVDVELHWTSGVTCHPLPFPCRIVPRSPEMNADRLAHLVSSSG